MLPSDEDLLKEAGRSLEVGIGWACAVVSIAFWGLLAFVIYLVAWRNPREYGVNEMFTISTLALFLLFFVIAAGFLVLAMRLLAKRRRLTLISPMLLRIFGVFFAVVSAAVVVECLASKRWMEAPSSIAVFVTAAGMSVAAFTLARRQKRASAHADHLPVDIGQSGPRRTSS
jgi:amino acid transporter